MHRHVTLTTSLCLNLSYLNSTLVFISNMYMQYSCSPSSRVYQNLEKGFFCCLPTDRPIDTIFLSPLFWRTHLDVTLFIEGPRIALCSIQLGCYKKQGLV